MKWKKRNAINNETISRKELIIMNSEIKCYYITGFADGEGSFNTSFRVRNDYLLGWKITPVFNISQKQRDILAIIKSHLKCGTIRLRKDGVWAYEVDNRNALQTQIIPFFEKYPFLSQKKKKDFWRFKQILQVLERNKSTTRVDLQQICQLVDEIESKSCRKYTTDQILMRATEFWDRNSEKIDRINSTSPNQLSSETTRQTM
jgi:hypothetical protein